MNRPRRGEDPKSYQDLDIACSIDSHRDIRVLLFVEEGRAKQKYLDALTACGVQVFVSSSFKNLSREICSHTYHGLLLDLPTKMRAIKENKAYVYHLVEKFPVSHLQLDENTSEVRCYHFNKKTGSTLLDFINGQCRNFIPQKIRSESRKELNLHVHIYTHENDKRPERTVTTDISSGGCFIISGKRTWKRGKDIWIRFQEMANLPPIQAQIRSVVKWGESREIPGIGVQFTNLSALQIQELTTLLTCNPGSTTK